MGFPSDRAILNFMGNHFADKTTLGLDTFIQMMPWFPTVVADHLRVCHKARSRGRSSFLDVLSLLLLILALRFPTDLRVRTTSRLILGNYRSLPRLCPHLGRRWAVPLPNRRSPPPHCDRGNSSEFLVPSHPPARCCLPGSINNHQTAQLKQIASLISIFCRFGER